MNKISKLAIIIAIYFLTIFLYSCCDQRDTLLNGKINTTLLLDFDAVPEAINNNIIKTGFRIVLIPDSDFVSLEFPIINQVYGTTCEYDVLNAVDVNSVAITFSKDINIGNKLIPAFSNLLDNNEMSSITINTSCEFELCEFEIGFPTTLVEKMDVVAGDLVINFSAVTDDGIQYNHNFETKIDLL